MGRSVYTCPYSVKNFYFYSDMDMDIDAETEDRARILKDALEWRLRDALRLAIPSLRQDYEWQASFYCGRECLPILANKHCVVSIANYGNLFCLSLIPWDDAVNCDWYRGQRGLQVHWIKQVAPRIERALIDAGYQPGSLQRFSNGEGIFSA